MIVAAWNAVRGGRWCIGALLWLCALNALGQRIQFPSPVSGTDPYLPSAGYGAPANPYAANPYPATPYPAQPYAANPYPAAPGYGAPVNPYAGSPYPATPYPANPYPATPYDPYSLTPGAPMPAPGVTPYNSAPYSATPNSLFPSSPAPGPAPGQPGSPWPDWSSPSTWMSPQPNGMRFIREIRVEETWVAPFGGDFLGVNDLELSATMQFPWFEGRQPPLLVTPGFAFHFWEGPSDAVADLPPRTYDAYLDFSWDPNISPWLSAELDVRVGVYSDFDVVSTRSIRVLGSGVGVINISPVWKAKLGVWYIDRNHVKLLPAVGFVWTPNDSTHWELFFPRPKLASKLTTLGATTVWWYVAGEYGGGSWTIRRASGASDDVDYNDIKLSLGVDWSNPSGWKGMFEIGYAFERELFYVDNPPQTYNPDSTMFLRGGLAY